LKSLNKDGRIHVVPAKIKERYIIRFTVTSFYTTEEDIRRDWQVIKFNADKLLREIRKEASRTKKLSLQSSLFLANAPQTPKIVNASFLAFCPDFDLDINDLAKELNSRDYKQSHLPLTPRRKPKYLTDKNYSFDHFSSPAQTLINKKKNDVTKRTSNIDKLMKIKFLNVDEEPVAETELQASTPATSASHDTDNTSADDAIRDLPRRKSCNGLLHSQASLDSKIEYIIENADQIHRSESK
jgi:hypothetical protein